MFTIQIFRYTCRPYIGPNWSGRLDFALVALYYYYFIICRISCDPKSIHRYRYYDLFNPIPSSFLITFVLFLEYYAVVIEASYLPALDVLNLKVIEFIKMPVCKGALLWWYPPLKEGSSLVGNEFKFVLANLLKMTCN